MQVNHLLNMRSKVGNTLTYHAYAPLFRDNNKTVTASNSYNGAILT